MLKEKMDHKCHSWDDVETWLVCDDKKGND